MRGGVLYRALAPDIFYSAFISIFVTGTRANPENVAPVGILIAIGFMICAMVLVIHKETHYTNRSFFINRIIASHALGLMAFSPIMFPNLLQISEWNTIQTYAYEYLGNTLDSISKALWGMPFYEPIEIENSTIYKNSISNSFVNTWGPGLAMEACHGLTLPESLHTSFLSIPDSSDA